MAIPINDEAKLFVLNIALVFRSEVNPAKHITHKTTTIAEQYLLASLVTMRQWPIKGRISSNERNDIKQTLVYAKYYYQSEPN